MITITNNRITANKMTGVKLNKMDRSNSIWTYTAALLFQPLLLLPYVGKNVTRKI